MEQIKSLRIELNFLAAEEDAKRKSHNHCRGNLQEAWDKLVHLRTHMNQFQAAIEDSTIEEVTVGAQSDNYSRPDYVYDNGASLNQQSASRVADINVIRDKARYKEALKSKLALQEESLGNLRQQIAAKTEELARLASRTASSESTGVDSVDNGVSTYLAVRRQVLCLSRELETADSEFVKTRVELEAVEIELSATLKKASATPVVLLAAASRELHGGQGDTATGAAALQGGPGAADSFKEEEPPLTSEFSLHEVLAGKARIRRTNGESAKSYRERLQKRLLALTALDLQLQKELEILTEGVRRARDELRDVEVRRLRAELALSKIESALLSRPINPSVDEDQRADSTSMVDKLVDSLSVSDLKQPAESMASSGQLQITYHKFKPFDASAYIVNQSESVEDECGRVGGFAGPRSPLSKFSASTSGSASGSGRRREDVAARTIIARLRKDLYGEVVEETEASEAIALTSTASDACVDEANSTKEVIDGAPPGLLAGPSQPYSLVLPLAEVLEQPTAASTKQVDDKKIVSSTPTTSRHDKAQQYWDHSKPDEAVRVEEPGSSRPQAIGDTAVRKQSRMAVADLVQRLESVAGSLERQQAQARALDDGEKHELMMNKQQILDMLEKQRKELEELREAHNQHMDLSRSLIDWNTSGVGVSPLVPQQRLFAGEDAGAPTDSSRSRSARSVSPGDRRKAETLSQRSRSMSPSRSPEGRQPRTPASPTASDDRRQPFYRIEERFRQRDEGSNQPTSPGKAASTQSTSTNAKRADVVLDDETSSANPSMTAAIEEEKMAEPVSITSAAATTKVEVSEPGIEVVTEEAAPSGGDVASNSTAKVKRGVKFSPTQPVSTSHDSPLVSVLLPQKGPIIDLGATRVSPLSRRHSSYAADSSSVTQLKQQLAKYTDRLREAQEQELSDPVTGFAVDDQGNSLALLHVTVLEGKNIPKSKRLANNADPFVELSIVKGAAEGRFTSPVAVGPRWTWKDRYGVEDTSDVSARTSIKWSEIYPDWRESFAVSSIQSLSDEVRFVLKDATRTASCRDEDIGVVQVPMALLKDQSKHKFQLLLQPLPLATGVIKRNFIKLPDNCHLKVELQLFFSKVQLYQQKVRDVSAALHLKEADEELEATERQQQRSVLREQLGLRAVVDVDVSSSDRAAEVPAHPGLPAPSESRGQASAVVSAATASGGRAVEVVHKTSASSSSSSSAAKIKAYQVVGLREAGKGALSEAKIVGFSHTDDTEAGFGRRNTRSGIRSHSRRSVSPPHLHSRAEGEPNSITMTAKQFLDQRSQQTGGGKGKAPSVSKPRQSSSPALSSPPTALPQSMLESRARNSTIFAEELKQRKQLDKDQRKASSSSATSSSSNPSKSAGHSTNGETAAANVPNLSIFRGIRPKLPRS